MMTDIALGPFVLPLRLLPLFGGIVAALVVGRQLAKNQRAGIERALWLVMGGMLLAARAGFVFRYRDFYLDEPLRMLDARDGGFRAAAGIAAGLAAAVWIAWRLPGRRKPLLAALAAGCLVWGAGSAVLVIPKPRQALPQATLATLDGGPVRLASMLGKPVVVNLWASWCPPCRREMPVLARAQREHPEALFVFVNQGEPAAAVRNYLAGKGLVLDNVLLDGATVLGRETGSPGLPTTLFFDARGQLVERRMGELSPATLEQGLETLRQAAPAANR